MLVVFHIRVISERDEPQIGWSYTFSCGSKLCSSGTRVWFRSPVDFHVPWKQQLCSSGTRAWRLSPVVSLALEAAAVFLWYASLASVSCGVSLPLGAVALFLWYASLASVPCAVSLALKRAVFVAAEDTLPIGTFFFGRHVAIPTVKACAEVCVGESTDV